MIKKLKIKNFLLFKDINIDFSSGSNGLVGESGAGKSIIFRAFSFLLGERNDKSLIRKGEEFFELEFIITINSKIQKVVADILGEDIQEELVIYRKNSNNDKNQIRINGIVVTLKELGLVMENLIEIHRQSATDRILNSSNYINILDLLIENDISDSYAKNFKKYTALKDKVDELNSINENREEQLELLAFQLEQLKELDGLLPEEELYNQYQQQKRSHENKEKIEQNDQYISDIYEKITTIVDNNIDFYTEKIQKEIKELYYFTETLSFELAKEHKKMSDESLTNSIDIEEQISILKRLKRKYNLDQEGLIKKKKDLEEKQHQYEELSNKLVFAEKEFHKAMSILEEQAQLLSETRKKVALQLEKKINIELQDLSMEDADFKILFEKSNYTRKGIDTIIFQIRTNKGYDYEDISKIASGGEKSRLMLILRTVLLKMNTKNIILFDEIDQGVSGTIAQKIGNKLRVLAQDNQLIVISHTPQVIKSLDTLYVVEKKTDGVMTNSNIKKLTAGEKDEYLQKMIEI